MLCKRYCAFLLRKASFGLIDVRKGNNKNLPIPAMVEVSCVKKPMNRACKTIVVAAFFNPAQYKSVQQNYHRFWQKLQKQSISLLTVELAFHDDNFYLQSDDATHVVQIRSNSILWQKERLYNVALGHVPDEYTAIVFMDADCYFTADDWLQKTEAALQRYAFVQPYSQQFRLLKGHTVQDAHGYKPGIEDGQWYHSFSKGLEKYGLNALRSFTLHGYTGMCIGVQREVIERHNFFDSSIVGAGDSLLMHALYNNSVKILALSSPQLQSYYKNWASALFADVGQSLTYIDLPIYHLWHGSKKNRQYVNRHLIERYYAFDPTQDITIHSSGAFEWSSNKSGLHTALKKYFLQRNDDA